MPTAAFIIFGTQRVSLFSFPILHLQIPPPPPPVAIPIPLDGTTHLFRVSSNPPSSSCLSCSNRGRSTACKIRLPPFPLPLFPSYYTRNARVLISSRLLPSGTTSSLFPRTSPFAPTRLRCRLSHRRICWKRGACCAYCHGSASVRASRLGLASIPRPCHQRQARIVDPSAGCGRRAAGLRSRLTRHSPPALAYRRLSQCLHLQW